MTTLTAPLRPRSTIRVTPIPLKWTVTQFHEMSERGDFEGRRAMLIKGEILEQGPMNPPHAVAGEKTEDQIRALFGSGWRIRIQKPLVFGRDTDPEPNIAVVAGQPDISKGHPTSAVLVVEISDTSLRYDTIEKMSLYASAGIAEYWVLDLNSRLLIVYREPAVDSSASYGASYRDVKYVKEIEEISPLAQPSAKVKVSDMLP